MAIIAIIEAIAIATVMIIFTMNVIRVPAEVLWPSISVMGCDGMLEVVVEYLIIA